MYSIQQHFANWGALYQTFAAAVFGVISIILWYQDRKKSAVILELQSQTKLLAQQLQYFIEVSKPSLKVINNKYWLEAYDTQIENTGGDLFDLVYNTKSDNKIFELQFYNNPLSLASNNTFHIRYKQIIEKEKSLKDTLTFQYKDKHGKTYSQALSLVSG
jgi:hypothetical protein